MKISISKLNENRYSICCHENKYAPIFGAMKKSQFAGIDLLVVEKFKAPIEKFNKIEDLYKWAKNLVKSYLNKEYLGKYKDTSVQREYILKDWCDYIKKKSFYNEAIQLFLFKDITSDLKPSNGKLPPILDEYILDETIHEIENNIRRQPKKSINFLKQYQKNLQICYLKNEIENQNNKQAGKWIVIPSKNNDPANFEKNIKKLKILSCKTWCTKTNYTQQYLTKGDFHIYMENGKPILGLDFTLDMLDGIAGILNNGKIPLKYFDVCQKYINENQFQLSSLLQDKMNKTRKIINQVEILKDDLSEYIKKNDAEKIFKYLGYDVNKRYDEKLIISQYSQPSEDYSFDDIGIDEKKLMKNVVEITGDANFKYSKLVKFENLEKIGGSVYFDHSEIKFLNKLKLIGGNVYFSNSQIETLGNLEIINGNAYFDNSKIKSLGKLREIGGDACFSNTKIVSLGNLSKIGASCIISDFNIMSLGKLKEIGDKAIITNANIKSFDNLKNVGGNMILTNLRLDSFGNLKKINGFLHVINSHIKTLNILEYIKGTLYLKNSKIQSLGSLKSINGEIMQKH